MCNVYLISLVDDHFPSPLVSLSQELHSLGSVGRSRELAAERRRMDTHTEGGSQSTMAGLNSEAPGADDLLLDNEDAMLGKVSKI